MTGRQFLLSHIIKKKKKKLISFYVLAFSSYNEIQILRSLLISFNFIRQACNCFFMFNKCVTLHTETYIVGMKLMTKHNGSFKKIKIISEATNKKKLSIVHKLLRSLAG